MEKQMETEQRIEQALRQGRWGLLDRLPAERQLAEEFGVSRGTLRAALRSLAGRGILATVRGSGTIVRTIPNTDRQQTTVTTRHGIEAFKMFMPPLVAHCVGRIPPSLILELERTLPVAGLALRNDDTRGFVQARFFTVIVRAADNPIIAGALGYLLPDSRLLVRFLQRRSMQEQEELFAALARVLSALRHVDTDGAVLATDVYATTLLELLERK